MVDHIYYSLFPKNVCPWCGRKWFWTRARRSFERKYGYIITKCRCGKEWKIRRRQGGFEYIEQ